MLSLLNNSSILSFVIICSFGFPRRLSLGIFILNHIKKERNKNFIKLLKIIKNAVVVYVFFVSFFLKVDEYSRIFYLFFTHIKHCFFSLLATLLNGFLRWFVI